MLFNCLFLRKCMKTVLAGCLRPPVPMNWSKVPQGVDLSRARPSPLVGTPAQPRRNERSRACFRLLVMKKSTRNGLRVKCFQEMSKHVHTCELSPSQGGEGAEVVRGVGLPQCGEGGGTGARVSCHRQKRTV